MKMDFHAALLAFAALSFCSIAVNAQELEGELSTVSYSEECADTAATCGCDDTSSCDACETSCDPCCGGGWLSNLPCCGHCDAWTLFPENCCGIEIGGWVSGGYYGNARGVKTQSGNGPLGFNNNSDDPMLNQVWLYAENVADAETYCFDLGYRVDAMFGADGPDTQAFGHGNRNVWDNAWDSGSDYGGAIPQAYVTAAWTDWTVKAGHFYTLIGYEVVQAPDNFFYSHAYTMYYGEPFTHTGAVAEYTGVNNLNLYAGWTMGWDTAFDSYEGGSSFLGGFSAQLNDRVTATYMVSTGDFGKNASNNSDFFFMSSFVVDVDLGCGLNYVFQHDFGFEDEGQDANEDLYWYGVNQYLVKEINDCWSIGARLEWFCDEDGLRIPASGPGNYYAATLGVNWKPNANLTVRPEVRFDKFDDRENSGSTPFADGTHDDIMFYGLDAIFTF